MDYQNSPVPSRLIAFALETEHGQIEAVTQCLTSVNADGSFECRSLKPGPYVLLVEPLPRQITLKGGSRRHTEAVKPPLYALYPQTPGLNHGDLIQLKAGQTEWADIIVGSDYPSVIHVKSATNAENSRVEIFLQSGDLSLPVSLIHEAIDSTTDEYTLLNVPPGTYLISQSWSANGKEDSASKSITVGQSSEVYLALSAVPSYEVFGSVQYSSPPATHSPVVALSSLAEDASRRYIATVAEDGQFTFKNVASGTYEISFEAGDGLLINEVKSGDHSMQGVLIKVNDNLARFPLLLTASPTTASISGMLEIEGDESKPGVLVHSINSDSNILVRTDARGMFSVSGLAPGNYLLYGWDDISAVPYENYGFLRRFADHAKSIELENGFHLTAVYIDCNKAELLGTDKAESSNDK